MSDKVLNMLLMIAEVFSLIASTYTIEKQLQYLQKINTCLHVKRKPYLL